ncbi:Yip1 family protein [Metabacillus fastidiosus]|uniref:Yip1 family protein n=1 Tax=Metabacillus fastidiosus TaxID=1458 RepID=UPI002E1DCC79|nr:Yip1 family protein [Metabacillus fastidiosus]
MTEVELSKNIVEKKPSLFGMIFSPSEQFERIRERPVIWIPFIIVTLIGLAAAVIGVLGIDSSAQINQLGLPAEEAAEIEASMKVGMIIGGIFLAPIAVLFSTVIYFAIAKIAKSEVTFKKMLSLNIFIYFIAGIGQLINTAIIVAINGDPKIMLTSLNSFAGADGALGGILSSIEIFGIWTTILSALGLHKVAGLSKTASWTIAIVIFIIGLIFGAIGGAANEMLEGMSQF